MRFLFYLALVAILSVGAGVFVSLRSLPRHSPQGYASAPAARQPLRDSSPEPSFMVPSRRVVYVVDATGSMLNNFSLVRKRVCGTISRLDERTSFNVIVAQEQSVLDCFRHLSAASPSNIREANDFLDDRVTPRGADDSFAEAFGQAVRERPESIVFVTDGDFEISKPLAVVRQSRIPVNVLLFRSQDFTEDDVSRAHALADAVHGGRVLIESGDI